MKLTKEVAQFIVNYNYDKIPENVVTEIKYAFLDTIGSGIAGADEDVSVILKKMVEAESTRPISTIWGSNQKVSESYAALVNGAMAHAIDFDDVSGATQGHPSTVLLPAIMSAAEKINASGKSIILAYFVGFEVMSYIGEILTLERHYNIGWHGTSTIGVIGATAAVGKLYELTVEQQQIALGLAVTQASGSKQNFGTMAKPFHAGNAARAGVLSATLAKEGFTASKEIFESPLGFIRLYSNQKKIKKVKNIGVSFELEDVGLSAKKYPCCYATHRVAHGTFKLMKEYNIDYKNVKEVNVSAPKGGFSPVIYTHPTTGLEGKFSIEYVVAAILIDQKLVLDTFTDAQVQRESAQMLLNKVMKIEDESQGDIINPIIDGFVEVSIITEDEIYTEKVVDIPGSSALPLTKEDYYEKFADCAHHKLNDCEIKEFIKIIETLEHRIELTDLYTLLT